MKFLKGRYLLALFPPIVSTFRIESCGRSKPAIGHAITLAQAMMIRPIQDVQFHIYSEHGYMAMFKSNVFNSYLQMLMTDILHLPNTHAAGHDQEPTFVCARPGEGPKYGIDYDPADRCAQTGETSFWVKNSVLVFLCPKFATLGIQPFFTPGGPRDIYCPMVQNNAFVGRSDPLVRYQIYDLVHQLAHLYLQDEGLTDETVPKEVTDWNACVGLGWTADAGEASVRNPFNLVYYVAFVNQECTEMPDPLKPPFSDRNDQTGVLSSVDRIGRLPANVTDLRLQS